MTDYTKKSEHQQRIEAFMTLVGQELPSEPTLPSPEVRVLRARLIIEEALETLAGLGVEVGLRDTPNALVSPFIEFEDLVFSISPRREASLVEIADGCGDTSVVTIGTLSACGINDCPLLETIDGNNLEKCGPGGYRRDDGKWVKPVNHTKPDILGVLIRMSLPPRQVVEVKTVR